MKCRDFMVGDWCRNEHGTPMQIIDVGEEAYAACKEHNGCAWAFSDVEGFEPHPIEITEDILRKNKWKVKGYTLHPSEHYCVKDEGINHLLWSYGILSIFLDYEKDDDRMFPDIVIPVKYVHQLQQVLRIAGMTDMANNFKV